MRNIITEPFELKRKDCKIVTVSFYDNSDIETVSILNIKTLKFEGMKTKDIKKSQIHNVVLKEKEKIYLQNKKSKIVAGLSKKHLNKIISTVFTRDVESRHAYLKKEIISNVDTIFYVAIPILKHPELKTQALFHNQIIHRFAVPLRIGGLTFFVMITVKERIDFKEMAIDEFTVYDLYSENTNIKKPLGSSSTVSERTFRSQYQMDIISMNDLINFVNTCVKNNYG